MASDPRRSAAARAVLALSLGALSLAGTACTHGAAAGSGGRADPSVTAAVAAPASPTRATPTPSAKASHPSRKRTKPRSRNPLAGKVIVLDPGHNGGNTSHPEEVNRLVDVITERKACDTTGTETVRGYAEHAFTWDVSTRLAKLLRGKGARVVLTRADDRGVGPCITERAAIGNVNKADAALSIHADGAPEGDHGFHIIEPGVIAGHNEGMVPDSQRLGLALRDAFRGETGISYSTYRGTDAIDVRDDLGGLNLSTRPKVFIECGNMKNPGDAAKLSDASFRQRIAQALADGFARYFPR